MEILTALIVLIAEILVGLIVLLVAYAFFGGVLTPKDEKLFSRIWVSEKSGASDAQDKAIQALLEKYYIIPDRGNLRFGLSHDGIDDVDRVGYNIGRLMGKVAEFDLKHQQSRGVLVSKILAKDLEFRLRVAGMSDFGGVSRVSPVQTALRNCTRDEGGPFGFGDQELIPSYRKLLWSKAMVVSVAEKSGR